MLVLVACSIYMSSMTRRLVVLLYPLRVLGGRSLTAILGFVHRFLIGRLWKQFYKNGTKLSVTFPQKFGMVLSW